MAIVRAYLPLQGISVTVANSDAYDVTIVGGASALTSQDDDSSYVRFPARASGPKSRIEGTFPALSLPAGAVVLDVNLVIYGKSETGSTFAFSSAWVYTGSFGTGQSAFFNISSGSYALDSSGVGSGYSGPATVANMLAGSVKGGFENINTTAYPTLRITYAALEVVYSDAPAPDGIPPVNQTIATAIPLPATGFVVDTRDIDTATGLYDCVFYTYTAPSDGNFRWWILYAEDPVAWKNDLTIYAGTLTSSRINAYDTPDSWGTFDDDGYLEPPVRYEGYCELVSGTVYTMVIQRSATESAPPAGPYTVNWTFTPDAVPTTPGVVGNTAISLMTRGHNSTFPASDVEKYWRFTGIVDRGDGVIDTLESEVYTYPYEFNTQSGGWVSTTPTGRDGLALWSMGGFDNTDDGVKNRIVCHLVTVGANDVTVGSPCLVLERAMPFSFGTQSYVQHSEWAAGDGDIVILYYETFLDPDHDNLGVWQQNFVTMRIDGTSLTVLDSLDVTAGERLDGHLVPIYGTSGECLQVTPRYDSGPSPYYMNARRVTWDSSGVISLGDWTVLTPDFTAPFSGYFEHGRTDHLPGTRVALYTAGWESLADSQVYMSVRALNIDTLEYGPSLHLPLGSTRDQSSSDALPFGHSASSGILADGSFGIAYPRFDPDGYYCLQTAVTSLQLDQITLTLTAVDTVVVRDGTLDGGGYQDDGYFNYRTTKLNYGMVTSWWYSGDGGDLDGYDFFGQSTDGTVGGWQNIPVAGETDYYLQNITQVSGAAFPPPNLAGFFRGGSRSFDP